MKKWHLFSFLLASLIFSGCSTQQYFILSNSTDEAIVIKYTLENPTDENALFGVAGEIYQSNRDYYPNWEHKLPYNDLHNADNKVQINLGPKSTLVFGVLSNDTYNTESKTSNGGKLFNLVEMKFSVNGIDFEINKDNFHDFFLFDGSGTYQYIVR